PRAEDDAGQHGHVGEEAYAPQRVLHRLARAPPAARIVVEGGVALGDLEFHARRIVVAQVLADALQLVHRRDADRAQAIALADAGEFQQLGRVDRARADDHLAGRPGLARLAIHRVAHADAALAVEYQRRRQRPRLDRKVGPRPRRVEVAVGRALAPS